MMTRFVEFAAYHVCTGRKAYGHDHQNGYRGPIDGALCTSWRSCGGKNYVVQMIFILFY